VIEKKPEEPKKARISHDEMEKLRARLNKLRK